MTGFSDSTDSSVHGGTGTAGDPFQMATLRGAVLATNASAGADTIILPAGTYNLTIAGNDDNAQAGDLDVTDALTIQGAGSGSTIIEAGTSATNGIDKIFSFNPLGGSNGFAVSLSGVTLRYGKNAVTATSPGDNEGGAFDFDAGPDGAGSLTMNDVVVDQNSTTNGDGGGIALFDGGTVNITNCSFTNNTTNSTGADASGGAIYFGDNYGNAADYTISNTVIDHNVATGSGGGGIFSFLDATSTTASLTLHGDVITNNTAGVDGGGVELDQPGTATIDQGTNISNNRRSGSAAGCTPPAQST